MFGRQLHLFTLLGFRVGVDLSWFLLAALIVWSLARGYFPAAIEDLPPETALWLAIAGAIGLFASIIFHEFSHALVARQFGMPVSGITLFLFGGVAHLHDEPPSARAEFFVAIAGPLASYALAGVSYAVSILFDPGEGSAPLAALFAYLAIVNFALATFNLLPAFPLDGGRVLRAAVWAWTGSLSQATRVGAAFGRGLGAALIVLGIVSTVAGDFVGGLWIALIGFFVYSAAGGSEMQLEWKRALGGLRVRDVMNTQIITVPADASVSELVDRYFYRYFHKAFPVVEGEMLLGCVCLQDLRHIPREDWDTARVADILTRTEADYAVAPNTLVWEALNRMKELNISRLMVVEHGRLRGMLTMRDLMQFIAVRRELAGRSEANPERGAPPPA